MGRVVGDVSSAILITIVIGTEKGDYCFFCRSDFTMEECASCGHYAPPEYFDGLSVCRGCFENAIDRDPY